MNRFSDTRNPNAKRTLLVVEDSEFNRLLLSSLLSDTYDVIEANNGREGLQKLGDFHDEISLVILDLFMPDMDGFEFLRRKQGDDRFDSIPVIVATSSRLTADEVKCLELGANDFIVKPYDNAVMTNRIGNMIRLRESAALVNQLSVDRITGLYSKEFFNRAIEDALASEPDRAFDMVCADIVNFRALNDRYGEHECDRILAELANKLTAIMPGAVAGGRIGGDAVCYLIDHQETGWEARLVSAVGELGISNLFVKFGIVANVDHDMPAQQICNRATAALETMKGIYGTSVAFFDNELHERQIMEQTIRESMEAAIGEFQFSVFFQPKHDMHTDSTGGAEALVRWFHPDIGVISPGMFIPIFERNGFITKLDLFVWEEACKEVRRCIDEGLPVVPISVNVSRLDFDMPDLPAKIAGLADKYEIDHSLLHVELTESAYSDNPERVVQMLTDLKELGFPTELDDFGAGYSSLVSLNMLPLDAMKLDMSMIHQATELGDFRIVESTIKLAKVLGLKTVVEGVETQEEAEKVKSMGCDMIQGFYYSKPLMRDDFEEYLKTH